MYYLIIAQLQLYCGVYFYCLCTIDYGISVMLVYLQVNYQHKLLEVLGDKREAVFELLAGDKQGETITVPVNTHTIHAE